MYLSNLSPEQAKRLPSLPPSVLVAYVTEYHGLCGRQCPRGDGEWFGCSCPENPVIIKRLHVVLDTVLATPGLYDPEVVRQAEELKAYLQGIVQLLRIAPV